MNRASRYLANVTFLAFVRVVIVAFCVCICHQAQLSDGKVFERCELAQVLRYGHGLDVNDVANWVCIAQHSSSLNSSAFGGNARSGSHGLFQISDQYWCSPPGKGVACGVTCDRLRDDDISDDLACVQIIYQEHQRLSGDGYNAWVAYQSFCRDNPYEYIEDCFGKEEGEYLHSKSVAANVVDDDEEDDSTVYSRKRGKVYGRCELAKELFLKHKMPMDEIPTWVCIAQHESNYDTSAVGRLNADGSADHGLFQISDLYWCHHKGGRRKACGLPCSKLLDADITDDVKCMKQIYKEHTRISGNGFTAWTVYNAYCTGKTAAYVRGCFDGIDVEQPKTSEEYRKVPSATKVKSQKPHGKVYEPCELAEELRSKHHMPEDQIATWVCIAKHESDYNTSAIGYGDHGLFQISDIYWCSPPGKGWACGLSCADLEDSDISDDVECIRKIYREHTQLSGDGFNAWTVYPRFCSQGRSAKYIAHCPGQHSQPTIAAQSQSYSRIVSPNSIAEYEPKSGKVYGRCELAKELLEKHEMGMDEIPTWVCIAHHESNFDTSAVGRLNTDGSADHGLFQISDLFWCSHKEGHRKACGLPCSKLLDNDISDDVRCVKQIHEEHTRISGDGFTAWTVYTPYCKERTEQYIRGCFDGSATADDFSPPQRTLSSSYVPKNKPKGKVFEECELANELRDKHRIPREQIATWVCIAQHQSGLNTSSSVSNVHGLFHISDEFWCSPPGKGTACELHCADLEDSDITDDVECIKKIYQEHQRLFGDGFNAWVTYPQHCNQGKADSYISHCPGFKSTATNTISYGNQQGVIKTHPKLGGRVIPVSNLPVYSHVFQANPFLKHFEVVNKNVIAPTFTEPKVDKPTYNHEFNVNPFLKHYDTKSKAASSSFYASSEKLSVSASEEVIDSVPATRELSLTTFLKQAATQQPALNPFSLNPFLKTISKGFVATTTSAPPFSGFSIKPTPTTSKTFGLNSYQPQNEEKAKYDAFKSLASPYAPFNTQPPRANRLQTYNLNTFKTTTSPTTSTFTTTAPATTRVPWYQLNTLSSAKPIVQAKSTSGYFFNRDSVITTARPSSVASLATAKPLTTTLRPYTVVSFSTVKRNGTSFNRAAVSAIHTSTSRPFSVVSAPQSVSGFSFNRGGFPSTQTTTLRPISVTDRGSGTSSNRGVIQATTSRPFSVVSSNTQKPLAVSSSSLYRPTAPSIQTKPFAAASFTTKAPSTPAKEDTGHYDPGRYDSGRYDSGRYDAGRYDSGQYDSKKHNSQPSTSSPVASVRTGFSSFGQYPTPTPTLHSQASKRIGITTLRPSSSVFTFSHPTPQDSRFLSKYISYDQDESSRPSPFTTPSPLGSSSNTNSLGFEAFSTSNTIPGVKITNLGNVGVSIHRPASVTQNSGQYIPNKTLLTPSLPTDAIKALTTSDSTRSLDLLHSASVNIPIQVDSTGLPVGSAGSSDLSTSSLPVGSSVSSDVSTSSLPVGSSELSTSSLPIGSTGSNELNTSSLPVGSFGSSGLSTSFLPVGNTGSSELSTSSSLVGSIGSSELSTSSLPIGSTGSSELSTSSLPVRSPGSSELSLTPSFTSKQDTGASETLKSSEKSQDSSQTSAKTEFTDSTQSKISSTSSSIAAELEKPSSIIQTSVDSSQIQSSSATTDKESDASPSISSAALPEATEEQGSNPLQSSKTESVKQPSSITLKPIPKTSSAFTAGSIKSSVALKPTSTATSQKATTKPSLRQFKTLTPTRSLPPATAQSSIPARSTFTSQSVKPVTSSFSRATITTASKSSNSYQTVTTKPSLRQGETLTPTRSLPPATTQSKFTSKSKPLTSSVSRPTVTTATKSTIRPAAPSKSKTPLVATTKSATTTRLPATLQVKPTSSRWYIPSTTTTSRSTTASKATSKPSFNAIKSAPTSPARPVPTPTLKKSDITSVRGPAKPSVFGGSRLPTATQTRPTAQQSPAKTSPPAQGSVKPTLSASKTSPASTRSYFGTSKPTSIFTTKPSSSFTTKKSSATQPSRTATSTRSSRSTRSITASSSSTGIAHQSSIIVTKPITNAQSRPANTSPVRTGQPAAISKTSAAHSSPTPAGTTRARSPVQISPTKPHRPTGSLFTTKLNLYEFYSKLYGSYPPTKTSSAQPATKTRQLNVVASSRTS